MTKWLFFRVIRLGKLTDDPTDTRMKPVTSGYKYEIYHWKTTQYTTHNNLRLYKCVLSRTDVLIS